MLPIITAFLIWNKLVLMGNKKWFFTDDYDPIFKIWHVPALKSGIPSLGGIICTPEIVTMWGMKTLFWKFLLCS